MAVLKEAFKINSKIHSYSVNTLNNGIELVELINLYQLVFIDSKITLPISQNKIFTLNCDEKLKSWSSLEKIISIFIENRVSKRTKILIIGGGVLQDAISFVCSIYNRGINYDFIPSTLLSMIDSCIGGKTSINFNSVKNKIGTYWPPNSIIIYSKLLHTLELNHIYSGAGEIFKYCLLKQEIDKFKKYQQSDFILGDEEIIELLKYKKEIVENGEFDNGSRLLLNYGHTFGHALEGTSNYLIPHGIAVIFGICISNRIACQLELLSNQSMKKIENMAFSFLNRFEFKTEWLLFDNLYSFIKDDKKNSEEIIRMILFDKNLDEYVIMNLDVVVVEEIYKKIQIEVINRIKFLT